MHVMISAFIRYVNMLRTPLYPRAVVLSDGMIMDGGTSSWQILHRGRISILSKLLATSFIFALPLRSAAFERYECTERWHDQSISKTPEHAPSQFNECNMVTAERIELKHYTITQGRAYWRYVERKRHRPCHGGGPGAILNFFDPVCYLPSKLQTHRNVEAREFWLVSKDGKNFRTAKTNKKNLAAWQKDTLERFAVDSSSAYLNSELIDGAAPSSFEVIFPFGDDPKWQNFSVARDRKQLYIDGWPIPNLDLDRAVWIEIPCIAEAGDECGGSSDAESRIGRIGNDILFLKYGNRPTVFRKMANNDLACHRRNFQYYCSIKGKRFLIKPDFDKEATLIPETAFSP